MTDVLLQMLLDDTERQLDAAFDALNAGGSVDLRDLPPRIEIICKRAIESGLPGTAAKLTALIERLDTLELSLRAVMATAQAMEPNQDTAGRKRAAESYRSVAASVTEDAPAPTAPDSSE